MGFNLGFKGLMKITGVVSNEMVVLIARLAY